VVSSGLYVCIYISHTLIAWAWFLLISSPDYEPRNTGLTTRQSRRDCARVEMEQARATWYWSD